VNKSHDLIAKIQKAKAANDLWALRPEINNALREQNKALIASIWHNEEDSKEIDHLHARIAELEGQKELLDDAVDYANRLDAALDSCYEYAGRIAEIMESGAGEPEPGNRLRQVQEGIKQRIDKARAGDD
jgi:hypothetical protein